MAIIVFEHTDISTVLRLGATLRDYGHKLDIRRLHDGGTVPVDLDDVHGVIACGGPYSANGDEPWIAEEQAYLKAAHEAGVPVFAICFGCQQLAKALGGAVGPLDGGSEIGWHDVHLSNAGKDDPLHTGVPWTTPQVHWHNEHVTEPPPGGRVLASSTRTPVQAFAVGLTTYAVQYHPEYVPQTITQLIEDEPEALAAADLTAEELLEQTRAKYPGMERVTQRMFESIALFLMPLDRRYKGLVKDLHH